MKVFANKKMKQFIIMLVAVIMVFNVIAPAPLVLQVQASGTASQNVDVGGGILVAPLAALTGAIAWGFNQLLNVVCNVAAVPGTPVVEDMFISTIVYNELPILDANIFNNNTTNPLLQSNISGGISGIVKTWYSITRMMALAASLVVLVYVAIKIILSSTGQSKAKYTELLKDWLLSLLLIFSLHYVMAAILFGSDAIVEFFKAIIQSGDVTFSYEALKSEVYPLKYGIFAFIYAIVWIVFLAYTFVFLILYIKRLILICFFTVIAPLIVLLNTINKIRGKGSDVLNNWLKQFVANVVMQPIDALLFTIVFSSINICLLLEPKQPLLALAFLIGFFPLRGWILQFFDQEAKQNSQDSARGWLRNRMVEAGKIGGSVAAGIANASNSRIPKLQKGNNANAIANRVAYAKNNQPFAKNGGAPAPQDPKQGIPGGGGDVSPEMVAIPNQSASGEVVEASSYNSQVGSSAIENSKWRKYGEMASRAAGQVALGVPGAVGKAALGVAGAATGTAVTAMNLAAGNGLRGYSSASRNTKDVLRGTTNFITGNGGIKSTAATASQYVKDRVANSYIVTGEHGGYQKQLEENNFWLNSDLQAYQREDLAVNGTDEEWNAYQETVNKEVFLAERARNQARNSERFERLVAVEGGNERKIERKIVQSNVEKWKKNGVSPKSNRKEVAVEAATDRRSERKVEFVQTEDNTSSIKHEQSNNVEVNLETQNINIQQELESFLLDEQTDALAHDLIINVGEGHPLYEEYNKVSSPSAKKGIAREFLMEKAKKSYSNEELTKIVRNRNYQELKKLFKK